MKKVELFRKTAHELLGLLRTGEIDPEDIVSSVLGQIKKQEGNVKAFLTLLEEQAYEKARELKNADRNLPLYGIPVAIKDNMCTEGIQTSCGSKILIPYKPPYDATIVRKIKEAGAIIIGKTNMDEFAMGSSCEHSGFFPTHNPWDLERVPGGSSGGSAAAVAAGECIMSTGSDTGGSIRQPASFSGVVGLKPTYGLVSRFGLVAFASSLDQIGPFTKDVTDSTLFLNTLAGYDPADSTSINHPKTDYAKSLEGGVKGMKIGVIKDLLGDGIEDGVKAKIESAIDVYKKLGAEIKYVEFPLIKYALPVYYLLAPAEASSNLARYDGVQYGLRVKAGDIISMYCKTRSEGFGDEVKRRIMLGTYALSAGYYDAYYLRALKVRTMIVREFERLFKECDVLLSPTAPTTAFKIGEKTDDPLGMYLSDICTIPVNLAGLPGISIPCGLSEGLPVGMQLIGRTLGEESIFRAAYAYELNSEPVKCML